MKQGTTIKPIRSEADLKAALDRVAALMDAVPGTPAADELDVLTTLIENYEAKHVQLGYPSAAGAIKFRIEQAGLKPKHLEPYIGSRSKVSEVLSGKRPLTLQMIRILNKELGIPADVLLQEPGADLPQTMADIDWSRFPVAVMARMGWKLKAVAGNVRDHAEEIMRDLIERAGGPATMPVAHYRKNDHARANAKADVYALQAWCWMVLATASETKLPAAYKPGSVTVAFMRDVAKLSFLHNGPILAKEKLAKHGIHLVQLNHLPKTHLDGAALRLSSGAPVIGVTVRYDRLDNFWFCLLHELAHIRLHMGKLGAEPFAFLDDLDLQPGAGQRGDNREEEADDAAQDALLPLSRDAWAAHPVRRQPSASGVLNLAQKLQVHPAVIAGRIRHETKNYRLLSAFVGAGEVRRQFEEAAA